jgi:hypothetical protein
MKLINKIKQFEKQFVFLRWADTEEYGKIQYVGFDFIEFQVLNIETLEYTDNVLINSNLILEVVFASPDINRLIFELSCNLPVKES